MRLPEWNPDYGPKTFNPKFGAIVIGARNILLAYNINLDTKNVEIAKQIAEQIRESGKKEKSGEKRITFPSSLKHVKAIGWFVKDYGFAQVSTNITNAYETPIYKVFETVKDIAEQYNIRVNGSELIGLIPLDVIKAAGEYYSTQSIGSLPIKELINIAVEAMGLNEMAPFKPYERIVEYQLSSF